MEREVQGRRKGGVCAGGGSWARGVRVGIYQKIQRGASYEGGKDRKYNT